MAGSSTSMNRAAVNNRAEQGRSDRTNQGIAAGRGRVTLHSTHEAAGKIAGIGAVLYEGLLRLDSYHRCAGTTILAGAYEFREPANRLNKWGQGGKLCYDAQPSRAMSVGRATLLSRPKETFSKLNALVTEFGGRIAYGERTFETDKGGPRTVGIVVASPHGLREDYIRRFTTNVARLGYFDLRWYEKHFPAILPESGPVLCDDERVFASGKPLSGSVEFHRGRAYYPEDATRPYKSNPFLVETEFYLHVAPLLWAATRTITLGLTDPPQCPGVPDRFLAHDWLGVPLWWAMRMAAPDVGCQSIYMAHECRIARLLVEGNLLDKQTAILEAGYDIRSHDVGFYPFMQNAQRDGASLDLAFRSIAPPSGRPFQDIPFHVINHEAERFGEVLAVGKWVRDETAWMLPNLGSRLMLAPNGIPALECLRPHLPRTSGKPPSVAAKEIYSAVKKAAARLHGALAELFSHEAKRCRRVAGAGSLASKFEEFADAFRSGKDRSAKREIEIWTSVSRTEASKGPWRLSGLLRKYLDLHKDRRVVMLWLANPYPDVPSISDTKRWRDDFGWPFEHYPRSLGGDLLDRDRAHYGPIEHFNREHFLQPDASRGLVVFINQFGWNECAFGFGEEADKKLLFGADFDTMRIGSDVELGLSVYEPYGLAPLEPFFSGKVCVLSDAFGCADVLQDAGGRKLQNLVLANYIGHGSRSSERVDAVARRNIEADVERECSREIRRALDVELMDRISTALPLDEVLSWDAVFRRYFQPALCPGAEPDVAEP